MSKTLTCCDLTINSGTSQQVEAMHGGFHAGRYGQFFVPAEFGRYATLANEWYEKGVRVLAYASGLNNWAFDPSEYDDHLAKIAEEAFNQGKRDAAS
jgi:hypothetical protein